MTSLQRWERADRLWAAMRPDDARREFQALLADPDWVLPAQLRLGEIALYQGRLQDAARHALAAFAARDPDPALLEAVCRLLLAVGELQAALVLADEPALRDAADPQILAGLGRMLSAQGEVSRSRYYLNRALAAGLDTAELRYLAGNDAAYAGDVDVAESHLEASLLRAPDYAPAHRALAKLRRATPQRNHVDRLRRVVAGSDPAHADAPLLHYALFKELDDLGDSDAAWAALETGMRLRRRQLDYDDGADAALFAALHAVTADYSEASGLKALPQLAGPTPIFIVGLPRSGTTLLERILGAHPDVADAGELRDAAAQLRIAANLPGGPQVDAALAAASVDPAEFGRAYLGHTQWHAGARPRYTDKLPANFLLLGHLANALPQARFVHMRREAMEVCFSNLKELFADAYPHSYDQAEMAAHYRRYAALMAHWRRQFPDRILDVDYAALVADPETSARRVLDFLELPWDEKVLAPEARTGTVATASSAQVREPIHSRFVGQWRRYESHLQPLREALERSE